MIGVIGDIEPHLDNGGQLSGCIDGQNLNRKWRARGEGQRARQESGHRETNGRILKPLVGGEPWKILASDTRC